MLKLCGHVDLSEAITKDGPKQIFKNQTSVRSSQNISLPLLRTNTHRKRNESPVLLRHKMNPSHQIKGLTSKGGFYQRYSLSSTAKVPPVSRIPPLSAVRNLTWIFPPESAETNSFAKTRAFQAFEVMLHSRSDC